MGALLGLCLGLGLALLLWSGGSSSASTPRRISRDALALAAGSGAAAVCTLVVAYGLSRSLVVASAFAALAGYVPQAVMRGRAQRRSQGLRQAWPDVVDDLTSAVRAGLSLPDALVQLGHRGPLALQPAFRRFGVRYLSTGTLGPALDELKADLADPVGDRVIEALRLAREVGGHDLGRLLRTLSAFLREDARTRGELQSRQAWAVNGARLSVAAPWLVLALLALHPAAVRAYDSAAGLVVLASGGAVSLAAYRLMLRIGRLPTEQRVLR